MAHCDDGDRVAICLQASDGRWASATRQALQEALSRALLVVVDLRELAFIDSTGLHMLIKPDARARRTGRRLVFVRGPAQIDRVLELIGLSGRLEIIDLEPGCVSAAGLTGPEPFDAA